MQQAVIAGYVRTPFTFAKKGALAGVRPDDLAAIAIKALVERTKIDPARVDDVVFSQGYGIRNYPDRRQTISRR